MPVSIDKIFKNTEIPEELDIVIIERKPKEYGDKVLRCFDFDDDLLERANQLKMEQWLED